MYNLVYFDTSCILSLLFKDQFAALAHKYWSESRYKVSSQLLEIESTLVIQRQHLIEPKYFSETWVRERKKLVKVLISQMDILSIDQSVINVINSELLLASCRSLDAIHLATAIVFKNYSDSNINVCSFDKKMCSVAKNIGFHILQETSNLS